MARAMDTSDLSKLFIFPVGCESPSAKLLPPKCKIPRHAATSLQFRCLNATRPAGGNWQRHWESRSDGSRIVACIELDFGGGEARVGG